MTDKTKRHAPKESALDAFIARKAEIDERLARLQALTLARFCPEPSRIRGVQEGPSKSMT